MEVTGILTRKLNESSGRSANTGMPWRTADFLLEIPGERRRHICFRVLDGAYGLVGRFEALEGQAVKVSFQIDAHEYQGRYYNELRAWGIVGYAPQQAAPAQAAGQGTGPAAGQAAEVPSRATPQAAPQGEHPFDALMRQAAQAAGGQRGGGGPAQGDLPF